MSNRELEGSHLPPLGSRVRRGPDWKYNNQDQGGPGTIVGHDGGTVSEAQFKFNIQFVKKFQSAYCKPSP